MVYVHFVEEGCEKYNRQINETELRTTISLVKTILSRVNGFYFTFRLFKKNKNLSNILMSISIDELVAAAVKAALAARDATVETSSNTSS